MTRTRSVLTVAIFLALGLPCLFARSVGESGVRVHVVLVGTNGCPLTSEPQVEQFTAEAQAQLFRATDTGKDYSAKFNHGTAEGIPVGPYRLKVRTKGFWSTERFVQVNRADTWVVVALEVGMDGSEGGFPVDEVRGRIEDAPTHAGPIFVRLSGVFSDLAMDDKAEADGDFDFGEIADGLYILSATQAGEVITVKAVEVSRGMSPVFMHVGAKP